MDKKIGEVKIFGYARVSTKEQNLDRQIAELRPLVPNERDIYIDKQSGKDFSRIEYQVLRRQLRKGDLLIVKSIDRFGRNYREIMEEWRYITMETGADIQVLDMPLLNTRINKDLLGTLISDIVLQLLSFVAENERSMIKQRQAEGIAIAKAKGKNLGRPKKDVDLEEFSKWVERFKAKQCSRQDILDHFSISKGTFYKLAATNTGKSDLK